MLCRCGAAIAVAVVVSLAGPANAERAPRGLYFHTFTGSFNGTEWSTWGDIPPGDPAAGRFEFSDLTNEGTFPGTIAQDGTFVLDRGQGRGAFTSEDEATIDFTISGGFNFRSELRRAPRTDDRFPVFFTGGVEGDAALGGEWRAVVSDIDVRTGETLSEDVETWTVGVNGTTIRLTDAAGDFFQGVWLADGQAGFRVIDRLTPDPRYRSFPGSSTSVNQNLVGEVRVLDENTVTAALFFQTRAPIGRQEQSMRFIELTRVPAPGTVGLLAAGLLPSVRRRRQNGATSSSLSRSW